MLHHNMGNNYNNFFKIDLSQMPIDIIHIIGKHLLTRGYKIRFNNIFRKMNDNKF
jgi:hypothetical protein